MEIYDQFEIIDLPEDKDEDVAIINNPVKDDFGSPVQLICHICQNEFVSIQALRQHQKNGCPSKTSGAGMRAQGNSVLQTL